MSLGAWRLRLLNELGTVEMLACADGDRLVAPMPRPWAPVPSMSPPARW